MPHRFDWIGIRTDQPADVRDEVRRFFAAPAVGVKKEDLDADRETLRAASVVSRGGWSAIHPPQPLLAGSPLCARLSRNLSAATLWNRVPLDFWEYRLYIGGKEVDRFSQVPERSEPYAESLDRWKGSTTILSSAFGVPEAVIGKYLVTWPREAWDRPAEYDEGTKRFSWGRKAHPEDEFPVSDYWVMCDFARRIGLVYDMPAESGVPLEL